MSTHQTGEEHRYLLARSSLDSYLEFITDYALNPEFVNRVEESKVWRDADLLMRRLRDDEAERADQVAVHPLPRSMTALTDRAKADPHFQKSFDETSYEIALVDLHCVVASQKLISAEHVARLQKQISPSMSAEELFRFCLPFDREPPSYRSSRINDDTFAFTSHSNDLRFLEAVMLRPDQIRGFVPSGPMAGVLALVVGFGCNYMNVISANGRLILNNGNHRACALFQSGFRQVPCVVQTIVHPGEFKVHMPSAVQRNPEFYLSDPRPPVIADYFHPKLSRSIQLGLSRKEIRLSYSVDEQDVP